MISLSYLESVIEEQTQNLRNATLYPRKVLSDVLRSIGMEEITVLIGPRRAGKTSIMGLVLQKYKNAMYINFEDERLYDFGIEDFERIISIAKKNKVKVLLLDEIQSVKAWEKFAHRVHKNIKLIISGSNSSLLQTEFSKALTGRTLTIRVFPLTFEEFLMFTRKKPTPESLMEYIEYGGFPRVVLSKDKTLLHEYFNAIIYRDVIGRGEVKQPEALKEVAIYLLSNIGKEFSYRVIGRTFGINEKTVKEYIGLLEQSFLLFTIRRFDYSLKTQEKFNKKVYAVDTGIASIAPRVEDKGRLFENMLFNHLQRIWKGGIYFYKNKREVDFLLTVGLKPLYAINSMYEATDTDTVLREEEGLKEVKKRLKTNGTLVSFLSVKGIETVDAVSFLLKSENYLPELGEKG